MRPAYLGESDRNFPGFDQHGAVQLQCPTIQWILCNTCWLGEASSTDGIIFFGSPIAFSALSVIPRMMDWNDVLMFESTQPPRFAHSDLPIVVLECGTEGESSTAAKMNLVGFGGDKLE